jgi:hypothetical protein
VKTGEPVRFSSKRQAIQVANRKAATEMENTVRDRYHTGYWIALAALLVLLGGDPGLALAIVITLLLGAIVIADGTG